MRETKARKGAPGCAALACLLLGIALGACARPAARGEEREAPVEASFVDDQGRRYVVRRLAKGHATRIAEDRVRTRWGIDLELAGEDAADWHFKYYLKEEGASARPAEGAAVPAEAESEAPPAPVALPESDTLRFQPFGAGLPEHGQWRDGFDVADLDGDGALDLVHGPPRKGARRPQVWLGDGRGGWRLWREARLPALPYEYGDARVADFDGDRVPDLLLANHLRGLLLLRGDGRGAFRRAGEGLDFAETGPAGFSSRAARVVDFDRDGILDVLALGEGPRLAGPAAGAAGVVGGAQGVVFYRGLGEGRFERRDRSEGQSGLFGSSLALGDFDADGRPDFAASSGQLGRRDLVALGSDDEGLWRPLPLSAVRPKAYVRAVASADFDGDGRSDLALSYATLSGGSWWSGLDVLLAGEGDAWRRLPLAAAEDGADFRALAAGDLDGDGAPDLVALDAAGAFAVFRSRGAEGFAREAEPPPPHPGGCRGAHLALADLDGDGAPDVLASFAQERGIGGAADVCPGEGGLAAWRTLRDAPRR